jgi:hypothetical protein
MGETGGAEVALSIGGIDFLLSCAELSLRHEVTEPYRAFMTGPRAREAADTVRVRFEVSTRPTFEGELLFSSDATWSILGRGEERVFVFREPGSSDPLYVARFRPGFGDVVVVCSPKMAEGDGSARVLSSPFRYPLDQILTMYSLAGQGFVIHSAGLVFGGKGLVFPGVSGAGKSTFASLARTRPGWAPLSDDRTVLRLDDGKPTVLGTPWPGEGRIAENQSAPAAGLLFLEQGPRNEVRPISPSECLSRLFPVVSIPWFDREVLPQALAACERVARAVPGAVLTFRPEEGAVDVVEAFLGSGSDGNSA